MRIPLEELEKEQHASIICYPRFCKTELTKRLKELQRLGIAALEFKGDRQVHNVPVLGKGCVGIVVVAHRNGEKLALKIRRVDADRSRMQEEASMLRNANAVGVGPRWMGVSRNFLLMQFVDGVFLAEWLEKPIGKARVRNVLHNVLEQCWRLDRIRLDHGELSHAPKHVIIDQNNVPFIVDFETASLNRKPSNVTSICHFLFISSLVAKNLAKKLGGIDEEAIVEALRCYKKDGTRKSFEAVLEACAPQAI